MKTWSITIGPDGTHLYCEEMPWYSWFIDEYIQPICCMVLLRWKDKEYNFHNIPLPKWIPWKCSGGEQSNLGDEFGDVGCLMCCWIIDPIWMWSFKQHTRGFFVAAPWPRR